MKILVNALIKYILFLAGAFIGTMFIEAESYVGLALFAFMMASAMCVLLTIFQLIHIGVAALCRRLRDATKH